jgi:hypothetical protein
MVIDTHVVGDINYNLVEYKFDGMVIVILSYLFFSKIWNFSIIGSCGSVYHDSKE